MQANEIKKPLQNIDVEAIVRIGKNKKTGDNNHFGTVNQRVSGSSPDWGAM